MLSLATLENVVSASADARSSRAFIVAPINPTSEGKFELNVLYSERKQLSSQIVRCLLPLRNQIFNNQCQESISCMILPRFPYYVCMGILPQMDDRHLRPIVTLLASCPVALGLDCRTLVNSFKNHETKRALKETFGLTPRQIDVIRLLSRGYSSSEVAKELEISIYTVESYIKYMIKKTNSKNRTHLVAMIVEAGIHRFPCK